MPALLLAPGLVAAIIGHAQSGYPKEVCGLIAGLAADAPGAAPGTGPDLATPGEPVIGRGLELYRGRNVAADPRKHFVLDFDTLALQIEFAGRGLVVSATYHSHPHGPETPSAEDIALALYPEAVCIVCSLARPGSPTVRGFLISDGSASEVRLLQTFDSDDTIC